jgi:hypothetical protein
MEGIYSFGMFVGWLAVRVLIEQKLESKFWQYLSYLPKNSIVFKNAQGIRISWGGNDSAMNRIYHWNTVTLYISVNCTLEVRDYLDPPTSFHLKKES